MLKMDQDHIPKVGLRWAPPGNRKQGRPKTTWQRTVTLEMKMAILTWGETLYAALDRTRLKKMLANSVLNNKQRGLSKNQLEKMRHFSLVSW